MNNQLKILQIGLGYWGQKIEQILCQNHKTERVDLCDSKNGQNYQDFLQNFYDSIIIATPAETHYNILRDCIGKTKAIFCEKPLTIDIKNTEDIFNKVIENNVTSILTVGYLYKWNPYINFLRFKEGVTRRSHFGNLLRAKMTRLAPGPVRTNITPVHDLAVHDISIINYILGRVNKKYTNIKCGGNSHSANIYYDVETTFGRSKIEILVDWSYYEKIRKYEFEFERANVVLDETLPYGKMLIKQDSFTEIVDIKDYMGSLHEEITDFIKIVDENRDSKSKIFDLDVFEIKSLMTEINKEYMNDKS